jgi:hypothetical protein
MATRVFVLGHSHAKVSGGGGLQTHVRIVPFVARSARPQDGLSLPPELGPFLLEWAMGWPDHGPIDPARPSPAAATTTDARNAG